MEDVLMWKLNNPTAVAELVLHVLVMLSFLLSWGFWSDPGQEWRLSRGEKGSLGWVGLSGLVAATAENSLIWGETR